MINNIQFKITAGKINKIHEFYTIFAQKMHYIIRQRDRGQAEANCLRPRPKFWPREDLTSLHTVNLSSTGTITSSPLSTGWESRYIRYSAYYWTSRLPCHRRSQMERPTGRSHLSAISAHFQKTTKTASRKDKSCLLYGNQMNRNIRLHIQSVELNEAKISRRGRGQFLAEAKNNYEKSFK